MGSPIQGPGGTQYRPVVAVEDPAGSGQWKLEILRTGEPDAMSYPTGDEGDYHDVRGMSAWPDFLRGNAVIVSQGTIADPAVPTSVQIQPAQVLGRDASSNVKSVRVGDLLGIAGSQLTDFHDISSTDADTVGRVLTVNAASGEDRLGWSVPPGAASIEVGTSAPSTVDGSILWYNSNAGHHELYYYDTSRTAWLSIRTIEMEFHTLGSALSSGTFLYTKAGLQTSSVVGYQVAQDLHWVGIYGNQGGGSVSGATVRLVLDGNSELAITQTISTSQNTSGYLKNVAVTAGGGIFACEVSSATIGANAMFRFIFRRTAS
jgi:hypothetical protein